MENKQLTDFSKWGSIYGVLAIVSGALSCLSIIGALIGVPMIFAGLNMRKAAKKAQSIMTRISNCEEVSAEEYGAVIEEVGRYAKIMGIITIVSFSLGVLYFIFCFIMIFISIFAGMSGYGNGYHYYY